MFGKLFTAPARGLMTIAQRIAEAVEEEQALSRVGLMEQLTNLHRQLEDGAISPDEFDRREEEILDRLESLEENS